MQPPTRPGPDPQGNPIQSDGGDDGEDVPVARMPPPNLGNDDSDDEDPDDDGDDDSSTSTEDSSDQSEVDSTGDEEAEQNEDGDDPIETAQTEEGTTFEIPFIEKLISFGMTIPQALAIVENGATNPNVFARLFTDSALTELFLREPLTTLKILVVERVRMFHRWLNERHKAGVSLTRIDLDKFDDNVMASLVEAASRGSTARERSSSSGKDSSGISLPTFSGSQSQYKVWNSKWRAYLGNLKNADGIPLLYVVVHKRKERSSVRHQLRGASLKGSQFNIDNFKVSQLLEIALADGSASIFTAQHPGNGRRAYLDLDDQYAGSFRQETRVQEIMAKLKTLQYRGAKSFAWDKFTNVLLGYYDELATLHAKVDRRTQVRNLIDLIAHEKTRTIAAEIIATNKKAKRSLKTALARIGERMQLLGAMTSTSGEGGQLLLTDKLRNSRGRLKLFKRRKQRAVTRADSKGKTRTIIFQPKFSTPCVKPVGIRAENMSTIC
ncbi:MAG: hypothetical protein MZV65_38610 [Chromatiales bacterium]|nr:hypothetical protein [Chromatiales bacterium]